MKIFFKVNSNPEIKAIIDENATAEKSELEIENMLQISTGNYNAFMIKNGRDDDEYYWIDPSGKLNKI